MAKVQGPLLSMGAAGQIGQSQVYARWKGRPYARRYVTPANPQSTEQTKTRTVFSWLNDLWRIAPLDFQAPWKEFVRGKVLTDRNAFMQKNIKEMRPKGFPALDTLEGMFLSPGAKAGLIADPTFVNNSGNIEATADAPDPLPNGWTVTGYILVAIPEQDPQTDTNFTVFSASAATPAPGDPWVATIDPIADGEYAVGTWFVYQRSSNPTDVAYGPSEAVLLTVTG